MYHNDICMFSRTQKYASRHLFFRLTMHSKISMDNNNSTMATLRLANINNSCFINSSLQFLYSIPKFRTFILEKLYFHSSKAGMQEVCESLFKLFSQSQQIQNVQELRSSIHRSFPQYSHYDTNEMWDMEEFTIDLLRCIQFEKYGNNDECTLGLFKGMLRSTHKFSSSHNIWCSNESCIDQEFYIYNLFLPDIPKNSLTLQGLVDEGLSIKPGGGLKKCYSCNDYQGPYTEQSDLRTYPEYLLMKVCRRDLTGRKVNVFIKSENQVVFDGNIIYSRISIGDHIGNSFHTGHWRVHNKIGSSWVTCNDTNISFNRSDLAVETKDNTVFLYKRVTNVSQKPDEYQIIEYGKDVDPPENKTESHKSVQNESKLRKILKEVPVPPNVAKPITSVKNNPKRKHETSPESKKLHTSKAKKHSEMFKEPMINLGKEPKRMKPDTFEDDIVIGHNNNKEHTLKIGSIVKENLTKTTGKSKSNSSPQACKGVAESFAVKPLLKSIEKNTNELVNNDDLQFAEEDLLCKGCGKKYQRLLAHLKRSSSCASFHDIEEMTKTANNRRKEQKRKFAMKARASETESASDERKMQDKEQTLKPGHL